MTGQRGFDPTTIDVFEKQLAFKILWDESDGVKKNPPVDEPEIFVGGFGFQVTIRTVLNETFLFLELSKASLAILARGFQIDVTVVCKWTKPMVGQPRGIGQFTLPRVQRVQVLNADKTAFIIFTEARFPEELLYVDLKMKFHDIFLYRLPFVDEEAAKEKLNDCKIVLVDDENKEIFVSKVVLAMRSPFFHTLFFHDSNKKKDEEVIKLDDVKQEDFLEYLYCVDAMPARPLAFKRIETLLNLANRFQNEVLKVKLEDFLLNMTDKTPKEKLKTLILADANNFQAVFIKNMFEMKKEDIRIVDDEAISNLKKENLVALFSHFRDLH